MVPVVPDKPLEIQDAPSFSACRDVAPRGVFDFNKPSGTRLCIIQTLKGVKDGFFCRR